MNTPHPPLPFLKAACKEKSWTYEDLAREAQKHSGTNAPGVGFIAQCVIGDKRFGPDTAQAIEKALEGRVKREWLLYTEEFRTDWESAFEDRRAASNG